MNFELCRVIASDHPSLPGHFPDSPIVPGVVILDEVLAVLAEWRARTVVEAIRVVKFLVPLKPDQPFTIVFSEMADNEIDFSCRIEKQIVAEGRLQLVPNTRST